MNVKEFEGTIAVIGGGMMGETMVSGLVKAGISPHRLRVADASPARLDYLRERYGVASAATNADAVFEASVVLLVVKPQVLMPVMAEIADVLEPDALVISLAAGIGLARLEAALRPGSLVVRVMPNTPAKIGAGMTVISPGRHVSADRVGLVEALMGAVGRTIVLDERYQDAAAAISGCGPAYVFLVAEALIDTGVRMGLTRDVATLLAGQMLAGSGQLLVISGEHPAILRNQVTSPGGTTAAALAELEAHGLRTAFADAMLASAARSAELGA